jgi:sulfite reductase beta subunit-like hemoprotein
VPIADIPALLRPTLEAFRDERERPEGFGDWVERTGLDALRQRFTLTGTAS